MLDGISNSTDMSLSKLQKMVKNTEAWHAAVHGVTKSRTWLSDWKTTSKGTNKRQKHFYIHYKIEIWRPKWLLSPQKYYRILAEPPGLGAELRKILFHPKMQDTIVIFFLHPTQSKINWYSLGMML